MSFIDRPEKSIADIDRFFENASQKEKDSISANSIRGVSRIWLGTTNAKPEIRGSFLVMNSHNNNKSFVLSVDEEEGLFKFYGDNGKVRLEIGIGNDDLPVINIYDSNGNLSNKLIN